MKKDPYQDDYDEEIIVFLQDWAHDFSDLVLAKLSSLITPIVKYTTILINGNGRYECKSTEGGGQFLTCTDNHRMFTTFLYTNVSKTEQATYHQHIRTSLWKQGRHIEYV